MTPASAVPVCPRSLSDHEPNDTCFDPGHAKALEARRANVAQGPTCPFCADARPYCPEHKPHWSTRGAGE